MYDLRQACVYLISELVKSTRNALLILHGEGTKRRVFWGRFGLLKQAIGILKEEEQNLVEDALVKLLEVLSLGCLYQIEKKLPGFKYVCNG